MLSYIASCKEEGATLLTGSEKHGGEGYFIQLMVFMDVKPDMKVMREEIFGHVRAIVKLKTEEGEVFSF